MQVRARTRCGGFLDSAYSIQTEICLAQQHDRLSAALPDCAEVALEPAGIKVCVQRHDDKSHIYISDEYLLDGAFSGRLARKLRPSRQNLMDQRFALGRN